MTSIIGKFNRLSREYRWFALMVCVLIIGAFWWTLFCKPLYEKTKEVRMAMHTAHRVAHDLQADYTIYQSFLNKSPLLAQQHIALLKLQLANINRNVLLHKQGVGASNRLESLLQAISKVPPGITIRQLQLGSGAAANPSSRVIVLKFRGDYFSTMRYLKYIEELPWFLIYDQLDYVVTQYPTAEVSVVLEPV